MVCLFLSQITIDSVNSLISSGYRVLFVDVRSESFYKVFPIIPKAINLPYDMILEGYNPPKGYDFYITVCGCTRGGIGLKAAELLRKRGFKALWLKRDGKEVEDKEDNFSDE